jgi:ABC-type amino acid transport substrate-binding protein
MITAGMYITPERAEQIYFSDPDYCIPESLAVEEGNPHGIVDYSSLVDNPDVIVAVAAGTVEVDYVARRRGHPGRARSRSSVTSTDVPGARGR